MPYYSTRLYNLSWDRSRLSKVPNLNDPCPTYHFQSSNPHALSYTAHLVSSTYMTVYTTKS